MKELSIEGKATRYDQAIKVAKSKIKNDKDHVLYEDDIIEIFPELKESEDEDEDEKIRKSIIAIINYYVDNSNTFKSKMIDWLEKQGEQKPADKIESSAFKDKLLELFQKFRYTKEGVITNGDIIDYVDAHIQELIGTIQKPAETEKGAKGNEMEIPISVWSEEVQEKQVSEEFINALGTMLNDGLPDRYLVSEERIKKSAELLFSIARKQLKNEMQEWSEEDEKIALSIEQVMNCASLLNIVPEKVDKIRTWLKSLKDRYTWKPSEEQMRDLIHIISQNKGNAIGASLETLAKELKNL